MNCEKYQKLMMGYMDDELTAKEREEFEKHLEECIHCKQEFARFRDLKELMDIASHQTPEDFFWDGYWACIYNKMERGLGWLFMMIGGLLFTVGAISIFLSQFIFNTEIHICLRIGLPIFVIGLTVLLVSVLRERIRIYKLERYKDVRR